MGKTTLIGLLFALAAGRALSEDWQINRGKDRMTDRNVVSARLQASEKIAGKFPSLWLVCEDGEVLVALDLPVRPEINPYLKESIFTFRFDRRNPQNITGGRRDSSLKIFLEAHPSPTENTLALFGQAKRVLLRFDQLRSGQVDTSFNLSGFSEALRVVQKGCGETSAR